MFTRRKFDNIDNPMLFFAYLRAFVDELGGDKVLFVDSQCKPLITAIGSAVLGVGQVLSIIDAFKDKESIGRGLGSLLFVSIAQDQGERDAIALVNRYGCKSSVARNVISGIMLSYKEGAK